MVSLNVKNLQIFLLEQLLINHYYIMKLYIEFELKIIKRSNILNIFL
jgi:hypothetical protein